MVHRLVLPRVRPSPSVTSLYFLSPRPRFIHSARPSQASIHHRTVDRSTPEPEEFIIPPIFDIFDAPTRLGQSTHFIQSTTSGLHKYADKGVPRNIDWSLPRPPPSALPPPIIFDGPACPRNLPFVAFQQRVNEALNLKPTSTRPQLLPQSAPESLVEVFDGPARLRRYSQRNSRPQKNGKRILFLGLFGAIGGTTLSCTRAFL